MAKKKKRRRMTSEEMEAGMKKWFDAYVPPTLDGDLAVIETALDRISSDPPDSMHEDEKREAVGIGVNLKHLRDAMKAGDDVTEIAYRALRIGYTYQRLKLRPAEQLAEQKLQAHRKKVARSGGDATSRKYASQRTGWQAEIDRYVLQGNHTYNRACELVAADNTPKVHPDTVRDHTENPKPRRRKKS